MIRTRTACRDHARSDLPGGITVRITDYPGGTELDDHRHDHAALVMPLAGAFQERVAGHESPRRPGELRLIPSQVVHADAYGRGGARCLVLEVRDAALAALPAPGVDDGAVDLPSQGRATAMAAALQHALLQQPTSGIQLWALAVRTLAATADELAAQAGRDGDWLDALRRELGGAAAASALIERAAACQGIPPAAVVARFRDRFGRGPQACRRRDRLEAAARMLRDGDTSISQIACLTGFYDQPHLTRAFRKAFGVTPARYRALEA